MNVFLQILKADKLPIPVTEYQFYPGRRWRFDYAYLGPMIAIEQEGGVWVNGAHNRGKHFLSDMEKYNAAAMLGWKVLRYTPDQMLVEAVRDLTKIFRPSIK